MEISSFAADVPESNDPEVSKVSDGTPPPLQLPLNNFSPSAPIDRQLSFSFDFDLAFGSDFEFGQGQDRKNDKGDTISASFSKDMEPEDKLYHRPDLATMSQMSSWSIALSSNPDPGQSSHGLKQKTLREPEEEFSFADLYEEPRLVSDFGSDGPCPCQISILNLVKRGDESLGNRSDQKSPSSDFEAASSSMGNWA